MQIRNCKRFMNLATTSNREIYGSLVIGTSSRLFHFSHQILPPPTHKHTKLSKEYVDAKILTWTTLLIKCAINIMSGTLIYTIDNPPPPYQKLYLLILEHSQNQVARSNSRVPRLQGRKPSFPSKWNDIKCFFFFIKKICNIILHQLVQALERNPYL